MMLMETLIVKSSRLISAMRNLKFRYHLKRSFEQSSEKLTMLDHSEHPQVSSVRLSIHCCGSSCIYSLLKESKQELEILSNFKEAKFEVMLKIWGGP